MSIPSPSSPYNNLAPFQLVEDKKGILKSSYKKIYYLIDPLSSSFIRRIIQFAVALFKTYLTSGWNLINSTINSQRRKIQWINVEHNDCQLQIFFKSIDNFYNLKYLHFKNNQLQTLPDSISSLPNLRTLSVWDNPLHMLPDSISNLSNLQHLDLNDNQLQTLPESIGNLSKLELLDLTHNQLQTLPDSIGNLSNLKVLRLGDLSNLRGLHLTHNQLQTLPESIGNLSKLELLDLTHNQLQTLPDSIGNLSKLEVLHLNHNQLQTLPDSIGNLSNLKVLYLSNLSNLSSLQLTHNQLQTLPDSIGNLSNLEILHVTHNQLQTLPDSIGNLSNLNVLNLNDNQLQTLPDNIGDLSNLRGLHLAHNQLQTLPESTVKLSNLQYLNLKNTQLHRLPNSTVKLFNLQHLDLDDNQLQTIPDSIDNLSKLKVLQLDNNQLQMLPDSIGNLSNLNVLNLNDNQLQTLPDSIGNLSNLRELCLANNQLQTLPNSIGNLSKLKVLDLDDNQFQTIPESLFRLPQTCTVRFNTNSLSPLVVEQLQTRLNAEDYQGPRFNVSIYESNKKDTSLKDLDTILHDWCDKDFPQQTLLEKLPEEQQNNLAHWLMRLKDTADYKNQKGYVQAQVKLFLTWMVKEEEPANLQSAYNIVADATSTCGDKVALSLSTLSVHRKVCQSSNLSLEDLKDLIIGLERYERLQKIALEKCKTLKAVDPVEVYLCYEVALKQELGLPTEAENMLYSSISNVTEKDITSAKEKILKETGQNDQKVTLLLKHPTWKKALEGASAFESYNKQCQQQKTDALDQFDGQDVSVMENYHEIYLKNENTIWDPYYVLTNQILEANSLKEIEPADYQSDSVF